MKGRCVIENDKFKKRVPGQRLAGDCERQDCISSKIFIKHVNLLADYTDLVTQIERE